MAQIQVLDSGTIDKIAAGEVVERPLSVVKELVENALDAGAGAITVETKEGGIAMIRVTDDGSGIEAGQVRNAFLRHATSKIRSAEDLGSIHSLGFRGEALSSISAVSRIELITKTKQQLTGIRLVLEGAEEKAFEEIGAPDGTTIIMRNLFFNTPVRRKFLKQPQTEGSYIAELMEHMAMSRPDVSFKLLMNGQVRFHTSGNGDLKEVIYRIYGRDVSGNLVEISDAAPGITIQGYLGKPVLNRSSRNFENYYVNGRYIRSSQLAGAIEEGYREYLMQHKFPFTVLHLKVDAGLVDVNVHPAKTDVRFVDFPRFYTFISGAISGALRQREMIPEVLPEQRSPSHAAASVSRGSVPEPFEKQRAAQYRAEEETKYAAERPAMRDVIPAPLWSRKEQETYGAETPREAAAPQETVMPQEDAAPRETDAPQQMTLFEEKLLSAEKREEYRILGQIFDTYWLAAFRDKLFIIDQHAAHEKVKYEMLIRQYRQKSTLSQILYPPVVVTLSAREKQLLQEYGTIFTGLGFEIEEFGGSEYALRSVPTDLYGCNAQEMLREILDELSEAPPTGEPAVIGEKIASMACKAAVKGNNSMTVREMEALIDQLLLLDNPYNCPHGRPTIISMSKYEIDRKFKRIV